MEIFEKQNQTKLNSHSTLNCKSFERKIQKTGENKRKLRCIHF